MANNVTITNKKTSFDTDTNADIPTRSIEKNGAQAQVVVIDVGGSGTENLTSPDFATQTSLNLLNDAVEIFVQSQIDPESVSLVREDYSNNEKTSRAISGASYIGDDGTRGLRTIPQAKVFDFSQDRIGNVAHSDVLGLSWMSFQITLVGTSTSVQPQFSNDGQAWVTSLYVQTNVTTAPTPNNTTTVGLFGCPIMGRFARLAIAGTTAGRCAGTVTYSAASPPAFNSATNSVVTGSVTVGGVKTNNAAIPSTTNLGVLNAVANAVSPTYTETFQTTLSVDLAGALRTALTSITPPFQADGRSNPLSLNQKGELRIDQNGARILQEQQIVQSLEESMRVLQSGEQYGGGNYGFEIR